MPIIEAGGEFRGHSKVTDEMLRLRTLAVVQLAQAVVARPDLVENLQVHFGVNSQVAEDLIGSVRSFDDWNLRSVPSEVKIKGYSPRGIIAARLGPVGWDAVEEVKDLVLELDKKSKNRRHILAPAGVLTTPIAAVIDGITSTPELKGTYGVVNYITVGVHEHKDGSGKFLKAHVGGMSTLDWTEETLEVLKKIRLHLTNVTSNALAIMRKRLKHPFSGGLGGL